VCGIIVDFLRLVYGDGFGFGFSTLGNIEVTPGDFQVFG
jgi:hypothetical protein